MKDTTYYLHQTPASLTPHLIAALPLLPTDRLYEPFKGEGAFYNAFPEANPKAYTEIEEGLDYESYTGEYDWVITNPPFQLEQTVKRVNAFWKLLDVFTQKARKGVAFLANDRCFSTLTPKRVELLRTRGFSLTKLVVCNVKKWRGRYYWVVFSKAPVGSLYALEGNFE